MGQVFVELYAGLAAVTAYMMGAKPPVSRIGAKTGYAACIVQELGLRPLRAGDRVVLVEKDQRVAEVLRALFCDRAARLAAAEYVEGRAGWDARRAWEAARQEGGVGAWLLHCAGARGGIGGFKGAHKSRPNVDGFIPSRFSLAKRLRLFPAPPCPVEVLCADAATVEPIGGARVYLDPTYEGRQGYGTEGGTAPQAVALRWAAAGCRVAISEARPVLLDGARHVELTLLRAGQKRRSMTRDSREFLTLL